MNGPTGSAADGQPQPGQPPAPPGHNAPGYAPPGYLAPTYGPPGHPGYGHPGYGPTGYGVPAFPPHADHPDEHLRRGQRSLSAARWVLWALLSAHAVVAAGALTVLSDPADPDRVLDGEGVMGLGVLLYLSLGAAAWALLALWCSRTGRAALSAGNAGSSRSHLAWWGVFVPFAGLVLPVLAYRDAAQYSAAVRAAGHPRGAGDGWRRQPVPVLLTAWWVAHVVSFALFSTFGAVSESDDALEAQLMLASAVAGAASAVMGAVALGRLVSSPRTAWT